jgi:uncharacterized protein YecE (DUF72 family)
MPNQPSSPTVPAQVDLFSQEELPPAAQAARPPGDTAPSAATPSAELQALAQQLSKRIHLGTSSWSFPGWHGLVWAGEHSEAELSRHGLPAYAQHPLLRSVCLDRGFYRPISAQEYAAYAAQVPADFRFIVKAPALVSDAALRDGAGRPLRLNPQWLDPAAALAHFITPALAGLGERIGALVFEISPLPTQLKQDLPALLARLERLLAQLPRLAQLTPDGVIALEVRDAQWLTPALCDLLRRHQVRYCLGLHPRLPPLQEQLPLLRALWPGPFVGRWSLNRLHGNLGYEQAKAGYAPFNRLVDEDLPTRQTLAKVIAATAAAGQAVYLSINNKAEGSAPLSVMALARQIVAA